jgi:hypothetical protein
LKSEWIGFARTDCTSNSHRYPFTTGNSPTRRWASRSPSATTNCPQSPISKV